MTATADDAELTEADSNSPPVGVVDEGVPVWVIVDAVGRALSIHRTSDGAEKLLPFTPDAVGINQMTLFY